MQYAVFTHSGHRAHGFDLFDSEATANEEARDYTPYGFRVEAVCNDHPERPREGCPEYHPEIDD